MEGGEVRTTQMYCINLPQSKPYIHKVSDARNYPTKQMHEIQEVRVHRLSIDQGSGAFDFHPASAKLTGMLLRLRSCRPDS